MQSLRQDEFECIRNQERFLDETDKSDFFRRKLKKSLSTLVMMEKIPEIFPADHIPLAGSHAVNLPQRTNQVKDIFSAYK